MLILTRRPGESITIGEDVTVTVVTVSGNHVRLGISAPRSVPVGREEIHDVLPEENRAAARGLHGQKLLNGGSEHSRGKRTKAHHD